MPGLFFARSGTVSMLFGVLTIAHLSVCSRCRIRCQTLIQACKGGVDGSLPPEVTLVDYVVRLLQSAPRMPDAYQQAQRLCNIPFYFNFIGRRNEASWSEQQQKTHVYACIVI
ncbi:hypothetical protein TNCV_3347971 [Trichonephila clavipes]|nr:hypothetical protein TNCV_3347971 [Trichonephila clavipes]